MQKKYQHLFGPVPSRRFRRSLGVDLTPYKTCSFNCVFCQLGRTTNHTVARKEYVPVKKVIAELQEWLKIDGEADYITLSGSGEPTLHSGFGKILEFIRKNSKIPTVLLTNGSMLNLQEVREAASQADIVKTSLSAWDQLSLEWVNCPHPQITFDQLVEGQKDFRQIFSGKLYMEVFLINGINTTPDNVQRIADIVKDIGSDHVQLNTVVRPPAEDFATPLMKEKMEAYTDFFVPTAEVIAEYNRSDLPCAQVNEDTIFSMLQRRPCTADQIGKVFGLHLNEVSKYLGKLIREEKIHYEQRNNEIYYTALLQ